MKFSLVESVTLHEGTPISQDTYLFESAESLFEYMREAKWNTRIVYDQNIDKYFACTAARGIHLDMLRDAYMVGYYISTHAYSMDYLVSLQSLYFIPVDSLDYDSKLDDTYLYFDGYKTYLKTGIGRIYARENGFPEDLYNLLKRKNLITAEGEVKEVDEDLDTDGIDLDGTKTIDGKKVSTIPEIVRGYVRRNHGGKIVRIPVKTLIDDNGMYDEKVNAIASRRRDVWGKDSKDYHFVGKKVDWGNSPIRVKKENGKYHLIDGNHRVLALYNDGYDEVEVVLYESLLNEVYPNKGESKKDFIARFMSVTKDEYPDTKQRYAVAMSYWDRRNKKK